MKYRIKNTPFWGEFIGYYSENGRTFVKLQMNDGVINHIPEDELTTQTIKEASEDFMWSIFAKNGSRKNQIIFFSSVLILGFILAKLIL